MSEIRTLTDLAQRSCECPLCDLALIRSEATAHLQLAHSHLLASKRTVFFEFDKSLLNPLPTVLYVCGQCDRVPEETIQGNPTTEIIHHMYNTCPLREETEEKKFRMVRDADLITKLIENGETTLYFCSQDEEPYPSEMGVLKHYSKDHLRSVSRGILLQKLEKGQLDSVLEEHVRRLVDNTGAPSTTTEDTKSSSEWPTSSEGGELNLVPRKTAGGSMTAASKSPRRSDDALSKPPVRVAVPHRRSILKELAGIKEEDAQKERAPSPLEIEPNDEEPNEPQSKISSTGYAKKVLTYANVLYGHIGISKDLVSLIGVDIEEICLIAEDGSRINSHVDWERKVLNGGSLLADWFAQNEILAGCYVYIHPSEEDGCLEIAYAPIATIIKRCLVASWDSIQKRVVLNYEDVQVNVECSEHLFRSLVNVDDYHVLDCMAKLYGSVFDVLYLGMRDLYAKGIDSVHYRDLHNMVVDKRLHPQLGSVWVELSKNECFKRLGGGYWQFLGDPRIEAVLPGLLRSIAHSATNEVPAITGLFVPAKPPETELRKEGLSLPVQIPLPEAPAPEANQRQEFGFFKLIDFLKNLIRSMYIKARSFFSMK